MMNKVKGSILRAGKYWIGDPCYVLDEHISFNWDEFVTECHKDDPTGRKNEGVVDHQNITFAFFGTEYGDGYYSDNEGNGYGVDAGILGCIPVEKIENSLIENSFFGTIHEFEEDFVCTFDDGTISFGDIIIETKIDQDEEWDEDDEIE
jgi:hypothetical protein